VIVGGWVPLLVMKAMALAGRLMEKDAWEFNITSTIILVA
jgi:hypothetical protein